MAFVAGHNTRIDYDNSGGTPTNLSAYINQIGGFDLTRQTLETTAFGDAVKNFILGLKGGQTITLSGDWDSTLHSHMVAVEALTSGASQTLKYSPAGTASGNPYVSVETFLTNYSFTSSVGDKVTWSATLQATGAVTAATN